MYNFSQEVEQEIVKPKFKKYTYDSIVKYKVKSNSFIDFQASPSPTNHQNCFTFGSFKIIWNGGLPLYSQV